MKEKIVAFVQAHPDCTTRQVHDHLSADGFVDYAKMYRQMCFLASIRELTRTGESKAAAVHWNMGEVT